MLSIANIKYKDNIYYWVDHLKDHILRYDDDDVNIFNTYLRNDLRQAFICYSSLWIIKVNKIYCDYDKYEPYLHKLLHKLRKLKFSTIPEFTFDLNNLVSQESIERQFIIPPIMHHIYFRFNNIDLAIKRILYKSYSNKLKIISMYNSVLVNYLYDDLIYIIFSYYGNILCPGLNANKELLTLCKLDKYMEAVSK